MLESGEYVEEMAVGGGQHTVMSDIEARYHGVQGEQLIAESKRISAGFKEFSAKHGLPH